MRLEQIQTHISETLRNASDFVCVQLVDRARWAPGEGEPGFEDALRLEVGFVGGREVFGWAGDESFEERNAAEMLSDGAFSTGDFLSHARALFLSRKGEIRPAQEHDRYDYAVGELPTGYRVTTGSGSAEVLHHGSFWVDPESLELRRLIVEADAIPAKVGIRAVVTDIRYRTVLLEGRRAVLPTEAEIRTDYSSGARLRNIAHFEGCRAFATSSSISFGAGAAQDLGPGNAVARPAPGERLFLRLRSPIEWGVSRVGDLLEGELLRPARAADGAALSKGSLLRLRIRRLQRRAEPQRFFVVGLAVEDVEATLESFDARGAEATLPASVRSRDETASHREMIAERDGRGLPGVGTFYVFGGGLRVTDARMRWKVAP